MSKNGEVKILRGNVESIIRKAENRVAEKERVSPWISEWNKKMDRESLDLDPAIYHNRCGRWRSDWKCFVKRKIQYLDEQVRDRVREYGESDWMTVASKERRAEFVQFVAITEEIARGMSALAEELFLQARMREVGIIL